MDDYFDLCGADEIPEGTGRVFQVLDESVAVFNCDGAFFAIDDHCPHMSASLSAGHLENHVVACPWHAWRFDVRDGTWLDNPRIKTRSYPLRIRNSRVEILSSSLKRKHMENQLPEALGKFQNGDDPTALSLSDFQKLIRNMYYEKDVARGVEGTFMWLMEEIGELSSALRERDRKNQLEEFADVLAWLCTIANVCDIDLTEAIRAKYGSGCPGCSRLACECPDTEKP